MAAQYTGPSSATRHSLARRLPKWDPLQWSDLLQSAKTVLAGVVAWVVAVDVLGLEQPFLAPWSAVLVVHATVYRTFSRGAQQVGATVAGVLLAWLVGQVLGIGALGMGVVLAASYLLAWHRWLREEATTLATTAAVVLATHVIDQSPMLVSRLLDTTVGIVIGLLVNLIVFPPLRDRAAEASVLAIPHDIGAVLSEMAQRLGPGLDSDQAHEQAEHWHEACRHIDERIDEAWGLVRHGRESSRFNPRRRPRDTRLSELEEVLRGLEQAVADTGSMVRTLVASVHLNNRWTPDFRRRWAAQLSTTAEAILENRPADLERVRGELVQLAADLSDGSLVERNWHEYGGLLVNLRNVVVALDRVVEWQKRATEGEARRAVRGSA